jgi:hypothetical protein
MWLEQMVRRVGDGDKTGWPMAFQHAKYIMHAEACS